MVTVIVDIGISANDDLRRFEAIASHLADRVDACGRQFAETLLLR
jgi:hypothetical protein